MQEQFVGTMPVVDRNKFRIQSLQNFMEKNVQDFSGDLTVEQFKGGQSNPTYRISTDKKKYVLRRKPPGKLLPSAHAVDREFKVISALQNTEVPVPKSYCLCEDESVIGTMFYIMEYVEGRVFWDQTLPLLSSHERKSIYKELNRVIAELHRIDYKEIGLESFGKPGNYIGRQISRWSKQYRASETERIEAMENLMEWLPDNIPKDEEFGIVHGDYRLDNVIFHPTKAQIMAVLDWELSTLGHPLADFAYHCMYWRLTRQQFRGIGGEDLKKLGIPDETEYVRMYCTKTDRKEILNWDFYAAYNMFRLGAICQGIMGRFKDGTAASKHAEEQGKKARPLAEAGWIQVEKILKKS
ncbi:MAG: phosphotransferase family protein [Proteobacteria bacterium]|nr:phosphotransferase family protein [Pseudomonadota bacterium]